MTAINWLFLLNEACYGFHSIEKSCPIKASKSEIRRWFENKAIIINGKSILYNEKINEIDSLILFPNGKRKITLR